MNDLSDFDVTELLVVGDLPGTVEHLPEVVEELKLVEVHSNPENRNLDLGDDYTNVRRMLYFQQQMLMEAAKVSLNQARTSEAPRVMEVFSTLMGQMTITNKELLKVHKDMKDITSEQTKAEGGSSAPATVQQITAQNVFVGTPSELMGQVGSQYDVDSNVIDVEVDDGSTG